MSKRRRDLPPECADGAYGVDSKRFADLQDAICYQVRTGRGTLMRNGERGWLPLVVRVRGTGARVAGTMADVRLNRACMVAMRGGAV